MSLAVRPSATLAEAAEKPTVTVPLSVIVVSALFAAPRLDEPPPPLNPVRVNESVSPRSSTVSAVVAIVTAPVAAPAAMVSDPDGAV